MSSAEPGVGAEPDSTTSPTDPLRHLLDWLVYVPLGVVTMVHKDLPGLIAAGKQRVDSQLTMAKFVGKMAVRQVTTEVDRRLDEAERARDGAGGADVSAIVDPIDPIESIDAPPPTSLPAAVIDAVAHAPELADATTSEPASATTSAMMPEPLPIDGYESLAASQVVLRLGSLTASELAAIADYESSHRARRTILGKIHQLQAL